MILQERIYMYKEHMNNNLYQQMSLHPKTNIIVFPNFFENATIQFEIRTIQIVNIYVNDLIGRTIKQ